MLKNNYLKNQFEIIKNKYPHEKLFHETILKMLKTVDEIIDEHPEYEKHNVVARLLEPERTIQFKVSFVDEFGKTHVNTGYRVQYNSSLGLYKGGIRFHPSVNLDVLKSLAFEQTFKNALTPILMGGAKGGADFDPVGKSDADIMRFSQAYISELYRHIGDNIDVPAGDLGVGAKEVGYMYGYYKKLVNQSDAAFTGKHLSFGGVDGRTTATGYGLAYITNAALNEIANTSYKDKKVVISGSGEVALAAALKISELGGKVVALSNVLGYIYSPNGLDVNYIVSNLKDPNDSLEFYVRHDKEATFDDKFTKIWELPCDIAHPCATQNELGVDGVKALIKNGVKLVGEGANVPTEPEAIAILKEAGVIFIPSKAANAGGVLTSGLEISQNHRFVPYDKEEVDGFLKQSMENIFSNIYETAKTYGKENDLEFGANVYSFTKVAEALIRQGV